MYQDLKITSSYGFFFSDKLYNNHKYYIYNDILVHYLNYKEYNKSHDCWESIFCQSDNYPFNVTALSEV